MKEITLTSLTDDDLGRLIAEALRCEPEHATELARRGYDEPFRRLWTLYLAYCEAGLAERRICNVQLLLGKPHHRLGHGDGTRALAGDGGRERQRLSADWQYSHSA